MPIRTHWIGLDCSRVIVSNLLNVADVEDDTTGISLKSLASEKQSRWAIWHCLHDPRFSHFHTIPACDRHTYRQTDRQTDTRRLHIRH